jgi:ribosomal protein S18 acetylase RimI-like enzyme
LFKIRRAKSTDATAIYNIWAAGWKYAYDKILSKKFLKNYVNDTVVEKNIENFPEKLRNETKKGKAFFVLVDNNKVVGFVYGGLPSLPKYKCDSELDTIYLHPEYIGTGGGKLLFQHFAKEMKSKGCKTLGLWCFSNNKSIGFYKHMAGVTIDYQRNKEIENIMVAYIKFDIDKVLEK